MKAIVADRGQVTVPKALWDQVGIAPRAVLEFREENGKLVAEKTPLTDPVTCVLGCLKLRKSTNQLISEMRGDA